MSRVPMIDVMLFFSSRRRHTRYWCDWSSDVCSSDLYPGKRYYGGCEQVDKVEVLAIERAREIFGAEHVNVQPHSGSQANEAAYAALIEPGDKVLSKIGRASCRERV